MLVRLMFVACRAAVWSISSANWAKHRRATIEFFDAALHGVKAERRAILRTGNLDASGSAAHRPLRIAGD